MERMVISNTSLKNEKKFKKMNEFNKTVRYYFNFLKIYSRTPMPI